MFNSQNAIVNKILFCLTLLAVVFCQACGRDAGSEGAAEAAVAADQQDQQQRARAERIEQLNSRVQYYTELRDQATKYERIAELDRMLEALRSAQACLAQADKSINECLLRRIELRRGSHTALRTVNVSTYELSE